MDNPGIFDAVVFNRLGEPPAMMVSQIERLLSSKEQDLKTVRDIVETVTMIQKTIVASYAPRPLPVQHDYVFVLMPMIPEDPLLEDAHEAIKRAAKSCGLRAQRVDDMVFTEQITDKVLGNIRVAQFIIADLTHGRPNVYYELGYAHAYNKPTFLVARKGTRPHFDVQGYPIITYASSAELERNLCRCFKESQGNGD